MFAGVLLFCAGAWFLQQQASLPSIAACYLFVAAVAVRVLARDALAFLGRLPDVALYAMAGFLWAALMAHVSLTQRLPAQWEGVDVRIEGVVAELPQAFPGSTRFRFDVEQVRTPQAMIPRQIQLSWETDARSSPVMVHPGERWVFTVRLKRPHGPQNPFGFDREFMLLERGIRATGYVNAKTHPRLIGEVWRPAYVLERWRERIRDRLRNAVGESAAAGVLIALAIGEQSAVDASSWKLFTRTGVNHLMSISGLHITMLSGIVAWLTGWIWRRSTRLALRLPARKAGLLAGLVVAWAYAALTGFAVPAQRTVVMLSTMVAGLWLGRRWTVSQMLAVAAGMVMVLDPFAVVSPGFWLSFGAVALILYSSSSRLEEPTLIVQSVRTQWVLTLGLAPLLIILFQQVSLISPLANALAIPLVSLLVVPLTLIGLVLPGNTVLTWAQWCMQWCMSMLQYFDQTPLAVWQQAVPPVWALGVAILGVVWLLAPRGFPGRLMGLLALLPMFFIAPSRPPEGECHVDILDVGQGLSVLVQTRNHALLFDTGPAFSVDSDAGDRVVVPYLRARGIRRLDGMIVSHNDKDHSGGAASVARAVPVAWLASSFSPVHLLGGQEARQMRCYAGQRWTWDGVAFDMLHPDLSSYAQSNISDNNRSCVLRVTAGGQRVLLSADIEAPAEAELLRRYPTELQSETLIVPHHGSATSSTPAFVRAVRPIAVVFTNGYRNRFGHPREDVVRRYLALPSRPYRSDLHGMVSLRMRSGSTDITAWREVHRRYWYD